MEKRPKFVPQPAHTALGDVLTVIDLMQQVLRPLAEKRGLDTWENIVGFAGDEWFPSRLSFGKFKGRLYQEAREDADLSRGWSGWRSPRTDGPLVSRATGERLRAGGCGVSRSAIPGGCGKWGQENGVRVQILENGKWGQGANLDKIICT